MDTKTCRVCARTFPQSFFRLKQSSIGRLNPLSLLSSRASECRSCESIRKDRKKADNRWISKATDTRYRHSKSLGVSSNSLRDDYGWTTDRMAHDSEHAYGNGCTYCARPYRDMPNGLAAITLDIRDRSSKPFYGVNTVWCCTTCNSSKQATDPSEWAEIQNAWKRCDVEPARRLPLFE